MYFDHGVGSITILSFGDWIYYGKDEPNLTAGYQNSCNVSGVNNPPVSFTGKDLRYWLRHDIDRWLTC